MKERVLIIDACQNALYYNNCLMDALTNRGEKIIYATTVCPHIESSIPPAVKVRYCFFYLARIMSRVTSSRLVRRILRGIEYPFNMLALMVYVLVRRIKVVHIMWPVFPTFDYWVIRMLQWMGCRIVFTAHNPFPHESKPSDVKRYSRLYREVNWVIALTNFTRDQIVSRSGISTEKISVIAHGDLGYIFSQYPCNDALAEEVRLAAAGRYVIAFLGLIRPYKGVDYFIKAFQIIKSHRPDTFFLIAGLIRFMNQRWIEQLLEENCDPGDRYIDFRFLPTSDMKAYLSVTDVLVQPYIRASQSGNTVMAYSLGIPVVCTDVGGLAEMVEDGRTGYVVPPKDPQTIADAVVKCLEGDNLAKMSDHAQQVAVEQYSWEKIAEQTADIYRHLAGVE